MSIIFGTRSRAGKVVQERHLLDLASKTARYALDGTVLRAKDNIGMGFQPYHTHERSNLESQPAMDGVGNMVTLDGRIDNHKELRELLAIDEPDTADSVLVLAAFRKWGEECFQRLIGDWAFALWSKTDRSLYLARDHAGTRTLYFAENDGQIVWSTYLEAFFAQDTPRALDEVYAASYLACWPIHDRTPYKDITAIAPGHYSIFRERATAVQRAYWKPAIKGSIRYRTDRQYEEHFISLFSEAIKRRTGAGAPMLAHLSGGLDSTSIVCMCDKIRNAESARPAKLMDTLSFYDDSEPSWNETPYFSLVEAKRKHEGIHIGSSFTDWTFEAIDARDNLYLLPGADSGTYARESRIFDRLRSGGYRAIIAGTGGDELLGGVPNPLPVLADYLTRFDIGGLLRTAVKWCFADRKPLATILKDTFAFTIGMYKREKFEMSCPWLRLRLDSPPTRSKQGFAWRLSPSRISNSRAWWRTIATLPHLFPTVIHRHEYRYPYLDRDLVEFLYRIPPEQLVRPGERRSLMRRSLKGIVPAEILGRRRKAFLVRGPHALLQNAENRIRALFANPMVEQCGFVDVTKFLAALASINRGEDSINRAALMRTIGFELWMQSNVNRIAPGLAQRESHRSNEEHRGAQRSVQAT